MSGHSKWSTIKRSKEKNDIANAKVFTKIGREIAVAVKTGGADPNINPKLKAMISKAKAVNMPNDNIQRVIKKASGELGSINYENITYEGYGPSGTAIVVYALTDNKNRTASEVRHLFDKFGGSLGANGCVLYMFDRKGIIIVEKTENINDDDIIMLALESGAEDVEIEDEYFEIYTLPENLEFVKENIEKKIEIANASTDLIPQNYVEVPDDKMPSFRKLLNFLNNSDDVQEVYHNASNYEEEE